VQNGAKKDLAAVVKEHVAVFKPNDSPFFSKPEEVMKQLRALGIKGFEKVSGGISNRSVAQPDVTKSNAPKLVTACEDLVKEMFGDEFSVIRVVPIAYRGDGKARMNFHPDSGNQFRVVLTFTEDGSPRTILFKESKSDDTDAVEVEVPSGHFYVMTAYGSGSRSIDVGGGQEVNLLHCVPSSENTDFGSVMIDISVPVSEQPDFIAELRKTHPVARTTNAPGVKFPFTGFNWNHPPAKSRFDQWLLGFYNKLVLEGVVVQVAGVSREEKIKIARHHAGEYFSRRLVSKCATIVVVSLMNRIFLTRLQQHVIPFPFTPNCCQPIRNSPPPLRIAGKASEKAWAAFAALLEKERKDKLPNFIKSTPTLLALVGLGMNDKKSWDKLTIQDIEKAVRAAQAAAGELRPPFIRPLLLLSSSPPPLKLCTLNICSPFCSSTTGKIGGSLSIPFRVILPVLCAIIVVVSLMNRIFLTRLQQVNGAHSRKRKKYIPAGKTSPTPTKLV